MFCIKSDRLEEERSKGRREEAKMTPLLFSSPRKVCVHAELFFRPLRVKRNERGEESRPLCEMETFFEFFGQLAVFFGVRVPERPQSRRKGKREKTEQEEGKKRTEWMGKEMEERESERAVHEDQRGEREERRRSGEERRMEERKERSEEEKENLNEGRKSMV